MQLNFHHLYFKMKNEKQSRVYLFLKLIGRLWWKVIDCIIIDILITEGLRKGGGGWCLVDVIFAQCCNHRLPKGNIVRKLQITFIFSMLTSVTLYRPRITQVAPLVPHHFQVIVSDYLGVSFIQKVSGTSSRQIMVTPYLGLAKTPHHPRFF